ncbi:hypothetical protein ACFLWV_02995, partial [Chloroflexota bacterium]
QKVSRLLKGYFQGLSQVDIAQITGVDQSTVSLYSTRFKDRAGSIGLLPAGKEYAVVNEVNALRSLAVELYQAGLTVEDANKGLLIMKDFIKLGIDPRQHATLVKVCGEISDPNFIQCAVKLASIEAETKMTYEKIITKLEKAVAELPDAEKKLKDTQSELELTISSLSEKEHKLKKLGGQLTQIQKDTRSKKEELEKELKAKIKQSGLQKAEVEEFSKLKVQLKKQGLDMSTLIKLAKEFGYGKGKS